MTVEYTVSPDGEIWTWSEVLLLGIKIEDRPEEHLGYCITILTSKGPIHIKGCHDRGPTLGEIPTWLQDPHYPAAPSS